MIYGEEVKEIDMSRGLWLADDLDAVPDGFCANLVNFVRNGAGGWELRPNFITTSVTAGTFATSTIGTQNESVDYYFNHILSKNVASFDLEAAQTYHPVLAYFIYNSSTLGCNVYWWAKDGTNSSAGLAGVIGVPTSVAQYRDRHYMSEFGSSTVYRYEFTAGYSCNRTSIQVLPAAGSISQIVAFRDRIFAFGQRESRVYHTDVATTGGYPESWNGGNNFFDLPDSGAIVRDAFVHNDRLYMFTNVGVYQLYANGNPSSWQVIPVTTNIRVQSKGHVALINGVFVFTDMQSVFAYNGSGTLSEIGQPIKASFRAKVNDYAIPLDSAVQRYAGPSGVTFHPFLDGFILAQHFLQGATPLTRTRLSKYYYFDGEVWSEIRFDDDILAANKEHYQLIGTMSKKPLKVTTESKKFNDVVVEVRMNSSTTSMVVAVKSVRYDNTPLESNIQMNFGIFTKDYNVGEPKVNRFKEFRVRTRSTLTNFIVSPYIDGVYSNTNTFTVVSGGGARMHRGVVEIQRGNSIALALTGALTRATGLGGNQSNYSYPSFRINNALVVCNTDTRNMPNQETVT